jgi:cell division protein ZapA (FtsZ GTPase activity inhibitor)
LEQLVTIELFGQPYTFKAESEVSKPESVADFLVKEVTRVEMQQKKESTKISNLATMILTALNIANEHMELKRKHTEFLENISTRSTALIGMLDESTQPPRSFF